MTSRMVIEPTAFGVRGAISMADVLVDVIEVDEGGQGVTDRFFCARVVRVDTRLNAAFLDLGTDEVGFIAAKDARYGAGVIERRPINKLVHEGQYIIVQGVRDGENGKGPRLTSDLKLFGMFLVYRPFGHGPEASVKLRGRARAETLERAQKLFGEDVSILLRTQAAEVGDALLQAEFTALRSRWRGLQGSFAGSKKPGRLATDERPLEQLLRQVLGQGLDEIAIADPGLVAEARKVLGDLPEPVRPRLIKLDPKTGAFEQSGIAQAIDRDFAKEVPLSKGGRLIIEETAACVAIDVDGGSRDALDVDLDAAREIGRLVRLRRLGGTIIVDFVDLPTKPQRQQLEDTLKRAFKGDPSSVQIYPMSPLGIVQLSRTRRGMSFKSRWYRPCPHCEGTGLIWSLGRQSDDLLEEHKRGFGAQVRVAQDLHRYLDKHGLVPAHGLSLKADSDLPPGSYVWET